MVKVLELSNLCAMCSAPLLNLLCRDFWSSRNKRKSPSKQVFLENAVGYSGNFCCGYWGFKPLPLWVSTLKIYCVGYLMQSLGMKESHFLRKNVFHWAKCCGVICQMVNATAVLIGISALVLVGAIGMKVGSSVMLCVLLFKASLLWVPQGGPLAKCRVHLPSFVYWYFQASLKTLVLGGFLEL